ncbi:unnamed protein product [Prorocentrum cordatum]|uniref:Uncharacterized protein n=1 Tax=Prorocentrum cordatum TaxID=2364126 RepID=A0ABN9X453_9DINO|nr:unnamed protein product [Polarella glacialis]
MAKKVYQDKVNKSQMEQMMKLLARLNQVSDEDDFSLDASSSEGPAHDMQKMMKTLMEHQKAQSGDNSSAALPTTKCMDEMLAMMKTFVKNHGGKHAPKAKAKQAVVRTLTLPAADVEEPEDDEVTEAMKHVAEVLLPKVDFADWPSTGEEYMEKIVEDGNGVTHTVLNRILKDNKPSTSSGEDKMSKVKQLVQRVAGQ